MAGYIGTKAVSLSTTAADVNGNATIDGNLTVDTNTLHVDAANNRVGIGTSSPAYDLDVDGSIGLTADATNKYYLTNDGSFKIALAGTGSLVTVNSSGNVGIGTNSPVQKVEVSTSGTSAIEITSTSGTAQLMLNPSGANGAYINYNRTSASVLAFYDNYASAERMRIDSSGNVGIGTSSVSSKFDVFGGSGAGEYHLSRMYAYNGSNNKRLDVYVDNTEAAPVVTIETSQSGGSTPALAFGTGATERMRITSTGNVGIGTSNPTARLHVSFSAASYGDDQLRLRNTDTGTGGYAVATFAQSAAGSATGIIGTGASAAGNSAFRNTFAIGTQSNHSFTMLTNDTERLRIDSSGNLLVGTTSGSDRLTVSGNIRVTGVNGNGVSIFSDASSNVLIPRAYSVSTSGGVAVFAQSDGRLGPNASSQRYKTEIQSVSDVSWLYQLNPVSFYYKDGDGNKQGMLQYGLIAEEVDTVNPTLVHRMDGQVESVHYHQLYAPLLKAIQDQHTIIEGQTAALQEALNEITDLKARVAALEAV